MSKLKLKVKKKSSCNSKRSDELKSNLEQGQSKLFQFINHQREDSEIICVEKSKSKGINNEGTTSKYFRGRSKDDSIDEFQPEKAKRVVRVNDECDQGNKKKSNVKSKKKKQNDGDLRKYTNEFEKVCAASGVDVNPEHLQLAIALSLSVDDQQHSSDPTSCEFSQTYSETSSQDDDIKIKRIRKTLSEYGFKVPSGPISINPLSKTKKITKHEKYFLLTRSEEEKKQIVSNAVSQIIFEDQICKSANDVNHVQVNSPVLCDIWCLECCIFSKKSLGFEEMSDECEKFYIQHLITPTDSKVGCLLKDWSKIPGRDPSPQRKNYCLDFREHVLYPEDLDILMTSSCSYILNRIENIKQNCEKNSFISKNDQFVERNINSNSSVYVKDDHENDIKSDIKIDISNVNCDVIVGATSMSSDSKVHVDNFSCNLETNKLNMDLGNVDSDMEVGFNVINIDSDNDINSTNSVSNINNHREDTPDEVILIDDRSRSPDLFGEGGYYEDYLETSICQKINNDPNAAVTNINRDPFVSISKMNSDLREDKTGIHCPIEDLDKRKVENSVKPLNQNNESSNDSLPDVFVSQMSQPKAANLLQRSFKEGETICVEDVDVSNVNTSKISECSIDLSQKCFDSVEGCTNMNVCVNETVLSTCGQDVSEEKIDLSVDDHTVITKRKLVSLGSIEDTVRFEEALKEHNEQRPVHNSIDLTDEDDDLYKNTSQIYKNDNGVLHYESYFETSEIMNISDSSSENCIARDNVHNLSKSLSNEDISVDEGIETEILNNKQDKCLENKNTNNSLGFSKINDQGQSNSFLEDLPILDKSHNESNKNVEKDILCDRSVGREMNETKTEDEIDLTQGSDEIGMKPNKINFVNGDYLNQSPEIIAENSKSLTNSSEDVFVISDEEFNYSINLSTRNKSKIVKKSLSKRNINVMSDSEDDTAFNHGNAENFVVNDNYNVPKDFDLYGSSIFDDIPSYHTSKISNISKRKSAVVSETIASVDLNNRNEVMDMAVPECSIAKSSPVVDKITENSDNTPRNNKFIIKFDNVTPVQDYGKMSTPQVQKELSKYGLKPLKRKRAIQILEHIYEQTHPLVDGRELETKLKKRKLVNSLQNTSSPLKQQNMNHSDRENGKNCHVIDKDEVASPANDLYEDAEVLTNDEDLYKADRSNVQLKSMDCDKEDLYFQNREKAKIHSCRVPLHIAFHNYASLRSGLQRDILTYRPVNIDAVHKGLVTDGYRYNPRDLLHFMDKKCITIKTKDGSSRQKKR